MELELVSSKEEILANLIRFSNYQFSKNNSHRNYYKDTLKRGKIFVFADYGGRYIFCPSRFVGYKNCTIQKHQKATNKNGSKTTPKINSLLKKQHDKNENAENEYQKLCRELNIAPNDKERTFWEIDLLEDINSSYTGFPDEVNHQSEYQEGSVQQVMVNRYERDPKAREACLKKYGYNCSVCNFNFEDFYGEIGKNFIHVHHLTPVSNNGERYTNPEEDLRPVCPNCHAMLHKTNRPQRIEDLKLLIKMQKIIDS